MNRINVMKYWQSIVVLLIFNTSVSAQVLADFETTSSTPILSGDGSAVITNPDVNGNASSKAAYYKKASGNWKAIYMNFASMKNTGSNDLLTFKLRSSTQGRVFVKMVKGTGTLLEAWAPEYNFRPEANKWTICTLNISSIKNKDFDRIEINASVDNEAVADVYLDDFKLANSRSPNGEPIVNVSVSSTQINATESIHFDASASEDIDGTIVSYLWDFGDGQTAATAIADHVYSEGIFYPSVTVQDNEGKKTVWKKSIYVFPATTKLGKLMFETASIKVHEKAEGIFLVKGNYANVYDPDLVKVDAVITRPDATIITVPCFYFEKAGYIASNDTWTKQDAPGYWMLRFSSSQTGTHQIQLRLTDASGTETSNTYTVHIQSGEKKGYIRLDANNKQYYRHSTGEPYYPLGINVAWNTTSNYSKIISNLGKSSANLIRYWQAPFDRQGLEWRNGYGAYKGLGVYSQEAAAEQDSIISLCEQANMYLQITLFQHGMFSETVDSNWADNPYNSVNGGPLTKAEQYFYTASVKERTRKLLRYIIARWGYSQNLFAWELFNEVNFTGAHPNQTSQWYPAVKAWHDEMGQYMKSLDAFDHPVTTSSDESHLIDMDKLSGLDIVQYHLYNTNLLSTQITKDKDLLGKVTRTGVINGEYGLDITTADVPFDAQRVSIWTGIMTQVPHWMWKWENYGNPLWSDLFTYPSAYLKEEDFVAQGKLTDWKFDADFGNTKLSTVGFNSEKNFYALIFDSQNRNDLKNVLCDFSKLPTGNYQVSFYNVITGEVVNQAVSFFPAIKTLELPVFSKAIAIKAKYSSAITHPLAYAGEDKIGSMLSTIKISGSQSYNPTTSPLTYQWALVEKPATSKINLVSTSGIETQFVPDVAGTYKITLTVSAGDKTSSPDTVAIAVGAITGSVENYDLKQLTPYPNPTRGRIHIPIASSVSSDLTISLLDTMGREVRQEEFTRSTLENEVVVELHGLSLGVYFLKLMLSNETLIRKILLVSTNEI